MNIEQVMTPSVEAIRSDDTVASAAKRMRDLNVGFLPVVDNGRVVGVVTDRDITARAVAEGLDPVMITVEEVMTRDAVTCFVDQTPEEAAQLMKEHQIRRILVVDRDNKLVGVVSLGDLAVDALADEEAGKTLQNVSWPAEPRR